MNKPRTKLYMKVNPETREIIYTGIEFAEFQRYLLHPIENMILLKGNYEGNRQNRNFELLEGSKEITNLTKENIYNFGNFHFVDYAVEGAEAKLSAQQVAELLYITHMWSPLQSPFFGELKNRFVYLAHDDGWFCKLYCHDLSEFMHIFFRKITANLPMPETKKSMVVEEELLKLAISGILVDLEESDCKKSNDTIAIYTVGEYSNMDDLINDCENIKAGASQVAYLQNQAEKYTIIYGNDQCVDNYKPLL